jgi:hypothetical protein
MSDTRSQAMMLAVLALAILPAPRLVAQQKTDDSFHWSGAVAAGRTVTLHNVNGNVRVTGTAGRDLVVTAVRQARKSDPASVEIRVTPVSDGVDICAVWPNEQDTDGCGEHSGHGKKWKENDVTVDFTVQVPTGVRFEGQTVNGNVSATGLTADAEISSVNGNVSLATTGTGSAETVNGNVRLQMGTATWDGDVEAKTVNGTVTVEMPTPTNLSVRADTQNGDISSDFPLTLQGKMSPRSIRGTIGNGGPRLELSTVNGAIELRKAN